MKCEWERKFNELHTHTTELLMWIKHNSDDSEGRRSYDRFTAVKRKQIDELVANLPKGEHGHS